MVHRSKKGAIVPCGLLVLELQSRRLSVSLVGPSKFLGRWLGSGSPRSAIEANIVHGRVVDDGLVVCVGDDSRVHASDGGVVKEHPVIPISALVTDPAITEAAALSTPTTGPNGRGQCAGSRILRSPASWLLRPTACSL